MNSSTLIGLWILAICIAMPVLLIALTRKKSLRSRAEKKLEELGSKIAKSESRLQIVRSHAIDYINSLGPEGAENMNQINSILKKVKLVADEAQLLTQSNSSKKLKLANEILDGKKSLQIEENQTVKNEEYKLDSNWERIIEDLIQELGVKVAEVSKNSKSDGIPTFGRQFKRETIHDLEQAGINIADIRKSLT